MKCQMTYECPNEATTRVTYFDGEEVLTCSTCLDKNRAFGIIKVEPIQVPEKSVAA